MKKKLLCIALGFLLLSVAVAAFTLSGSANNVITIATAEELQKIGADAAYPLNGSYRLTADINLTGIDWKPIGRAGAPFKGTFDGDGHVISGLTIGTEAAPKSIADVYCSDGNKVGDYAGMFGFAESAVFKNFALKDVSICIKTGNRQVGGIVGGLDNNPGLGRTHFENVALLSGTVSYQSGDDGSIRVGGFVGQASGNSLKFINCYMGATVIGNSNTNRALVGGFFGNNNNKSVSFENCVQAGEVKNLSSHANSALGPIISNWSSTANLNNVTMTNCYAHATNLQNASATLFTKAETVIPVESEGIASLYSLPGEIWTVNENYYPILTAFAAYAKPIEVIRIATAEDLAKIGADEKFPLDGDYTLTADIDLSGRTWTPIGTEAAPFTGTFRGKGHVISGLTIGTEATPIPSASVKATDGTVVKAGYGLFGEVKGATIQDLGLTNVSIFLNGTDAETEKKVGALIGLSSGVTIHNVAVISGTVSAQNHDTKAVFVGGLVGEVKNVGGASVTATDVFTGIRIFAGSKNRAMIGSFIGNINNKPVSITGGVAAGILRNDTPRNATGEAGTGAALCNWAGSASAINSLNEKAALTNVFTHPWMITAGYKSTVVTHTGQIQVNEAAAMTAATYGALGENWTMTDGYYPIPKDFATLAVKVEPQTGIPLTSAEDLKKIGKDPAYLPYDRYYLTNDIDLSGKQWTPIEDFIGILDGNGHAIIGLTIGTEAAPAPLASAGLFASLNGTVKNLVLKDVYVHTAEATYGWAHEDGVGALAGRLYGAAVIDNVTVLNGTVKDVGSHETTIGGIAGNAVQAGWIIRNSMNGADLIAGYAYVADAEDNRAIAGGILGNARAKGTIENCLNVGTVTMMSPGFADPIASFYKYMGAFSTVTGCYYEEGCLNLEQAGYLCGFSGGVTFGETDTVSVTALTKAKLTDGSLTGLGEGWTVEPGAYPIPASAAGYKQTVDKQTPASLKDSIAAALKNGDLTVTNPTTAEKFLKAVEALIYTDGLTVSWSNALQITPATASKEGKFAGTLKITSDGQSELLEISGTIAKVPTLSYKFSKDIKGRADGKITVQFPLADSKEYQLYWGDKAGILKDYTALATVKASKKTITESVLKYTVIPAGATRLWIAKNGNLLTSLDLPEERLLKAEKPKYVFGVLSDAHVSEGSGDAKSAQMHNVLRALDSLKNSGASFVTLLGDNTTYNNDAQLSYWKDIIAAYPDLPIYSTLGNHDILPHNTKVDNVEESFARFRDVFGNTKDYNYTVKQGDDLFIYLGLGQADSFETYNGLTLSDRQIQWLEEVLKQYYDVEKGKGHVFLMFHMFPVNTSYAQSALNGFNPTSSAKLERVLNKYPDMVWFSGHNHFSFDCDKNLYSAGKYVMLHTPSVGVGGANGTAGNTIGGEGYLVEVYESYVIVKGIDTYTGETVSYATFLVSQSNGEFTPNPETADSVPALLPVLCSALALIAIPAVRICRKKFVQH